MDHRKYIVKSCSVGSDNIPFGPRILCFTSTSGLQLNGEHVYDSLDDVKKNHPVLNRLKYLDPKRYQLITKSHNVVTVTNYALAPTHNFDDVSFKVLLHTLTGEFNRNGVSGIHYIDQNSYHIRILELVKGPDRFGVREVKLEVFSRNKNRWVKKRNTSTLFPEEWNLTQLLLEIHHAYQNKTRVQNKEYEWYSTTITGVPVIFIIDSHAKLKSVYPLFTNE